MYKTYSLQMCRADHKRAWSQYLDRWIAKMQAAYPEHPFISHLMMAVAIASILLPIQSFT